MKKIYLLIPFLILINSCCTKVGFKPIQNEPNVFVRFENFNDGYNDLDNPTLYRTSNTFVFQDSFDINVSNNSFNIMKEYYISKEDIFEMKNSFFVIKTKVTIDTIYDINYSAIHSRIDPNHCLIPNKEDVYHIENFSFYHKGIQYFDDDTIVISK